MHGELGVSEVLRSHAPARTPTQVERKRREVVSVGLRSCPSIARRSSTTNCVGQLRSADRHSCCAEDPVLGCKK